MRYSAILICALVFLFAGKANGQLTLGARVGYGLAASSIEPLTGQTRKVGFSPTAGLIFHYNLDLRFSAGFEVNYNKFSETIRYQGLNGGLPIESKTEISYLQIPITGRASVGEKKYRAVIELGAYAGFGLGGSWNKGPEFSTLPNQPDVPIGVNMTRTIGFNQNYLRKFDVGGLFGGGVEYKLGTTGLLFAEARIQLSLVDFYKMKDVEIRAFKSTNEYNYLLPSATWRAVNFSLGYRRTFKLPKLSANPDSKRAGKQKKG